MCFVASKERSDTKSESDENSLISPVSNKSSGVDINIPPVQQQSNQSEEVNKDGEHQSQDTVNQSQQEQCNHNQSTDQTQHDLDHQCQEKLNNQAQSDQQPSDQNQTHTNQDQKEVVGQLHNPPKKPSEELQLKQSTSEPHQTQCQSGQSSQQSEQTKDRGDSSTNVTTPSEPLTPNKMKIICNAPVPIGWPKVSTTILIMYIYKIVPSFNLYLYTYGYVLMQLLDVL